MYVQTLAGVTLCSLSFVVMQSPHPVAAKAHDQNLLQINASPCLARTKVTASTVHWTLALMTTNLKRTIRIETGEAYAIERIPSAEGQSGKRHDQNLLQINASPCLARTKVTASTVHWSLALMATNLKQCFNMH